MKQQEGHFFACGNGQHLLTDVNETAIIADRVFRLLSTGQSHTNSIPLVVKGMVDLEQVRAAAADAVFLRSSLASELAEALWLEDQEQ
jgi:hypothetical protein